jgi:pterin-4a-carbinolamine dehydratase
VWFAHERPGLVPRGSSCHVRCGGTRSRRTTRHPHCRRCVRVLCGVTCAALRWALQSTGRDVLVKKLTFADFKAAWKFMNGVAEYADAADHHPEWFNVYNRVDITLSTHDAGGVTQKVRPDCDSLAPVASPCRPRAPQWTHRARLAVARGMDGFAPAIAIAPRRLQDFDLAAHIDRCAAAAGKVTLR